MVHKRFKCQLFLQFFNNDVTKSLRVGHIIDLFSTGVFQWFSLSY